MFGFDFIDIAALGWFILCWTGYSLLVDHSGNVSLTARLGAYRQQWMQTMAGRSMRMVDGQINMHLQQGTGFFASTSLVLIGGCVTLLGATDEALDLFTTLPMHYRPTRLQWEVKVSGLTIMFIYAFFKFGWAYRLFNYCAILIGATPEPGTADKEEIEAMAARAARMNIAAASHFNRGQRAFFFALGYLGWFIHPVALIIASSAVVIVLYRRQFKSDALKALL